jgi:hypothetical protein
MPHRADARGAAVDIMERKMLQRTNKRKEYAVPMMTVAVLLTMLLPLVAFGQATTYISVTDGVRTGIASRLSSSTSLTWTNKGGVWRVVGDLSLGSGGADSNTVSAMIADGTSLNASNWLGWAGASNWLHTAFYPLGSNPSNYLTSIDWTANPSNSVLQGSINGKASTGTVINVTGNGNSGSVTVGTGGTITLGSDASKLDTNDSRLAYGAAYVIGLDGRETWYGTNLEAWAAASTGGVTSVLLPGRYSAERIYINNPGGRLLATDAWVTCTPTNGSNISGFTALGVTEVNGLQVRSVFQAPYNLASGNHFYGLIIGATNAAVRNVTVQLEATGAATPDLNGKVLVACCGFSASNRFDGCTFISLTGTSSVYASPFVATHEGTAQFFEQCRFVANKTATPLDVGNLGVYRDCSFAGVSFSAGTYGFTNTFGAFGLVSEPEARRMVFPGTESLLAAGAGGTNIYFAGSYAASWPLNYFTSTNTSANNLFSRAAVPVGRRTAGSDATHNYYSVDYVPRVYDYTTKFGAGLYRIRTKSEIGSVGAGSYRAKPVHEEGVLVDDYFQTYVNNFRTYSAPLAEYGSWRVVVTATMVSEWAFGTNQQGWKTWIWPNEVKAIYGTALTPTLSDYYRLEFTMDGSTNWTDGAVYQISSNWWFECGATRSNTNKVNAHLILSTSASLPATNTPVYEIVGTNTNVLTGVTYSSCNTAIGSGKSGVYIGRDGVPVVFGSLNGKGFHIRYELDGR